jgi:hypothetical protein
VTADWRQLRTTFEEVPELYRRIRRRIDSRPGETVTKACLATLNLGRRTN